MRNIILAAVAIVAGLGIFVWFLVVDWNTQHFEPIVKEHFAAMVGLPAIAFGAFILVNLLEQQSGPVKFKGLGFEFDGSSGQIAMWIACFLSMSAALKMLW